MTATARTMSDIRLAASEMDVLGLLVLMPTNTTPDRPDKPQLFTVRDQSSALVLASAIYDVRRTRPILVLSPAARNGLYDCNPATVAAQLWDTADVVMFKDVRTCSAFNAAVPDWVRTYNGAARLFAVGADVSDPQDVHTMIKPVWEGIEEANRRVVSTVRRYARTHRSHNADHRLAELQRKHEETLAALADARKQLSNRTVETADSERPVVFSDPIAQFDHELYNTWLEITSEPERTKWALRHYEIGPKFLESLDDMKIVKRTLVMRAVVDVVTGRYAEINGREAKMFRDSGTHRAGSAPKVVRGDGATAWRCNIASKTAGAPRLMWWECADNTPELSVVAHHDDFRIF